MRLKRATLKPAISHNLGLYSRVFCISITHFFKNKFLLMARSVIQSVTFMASQQCRKFTWHCIPKEKPDFFRKKTITFCNINEWLIKELFTTQNLVLKWALSEKLQFASGDVFLRSLYSSGGLSMCQLMNVFLLAKSSHFLVCIIPAVHTRSSHFQFAFYQFAVHNLPNPL